MNLSAEEKENILQEAAGLYGFDPNEAFELPDHEGGRNLVWRIGSESVLRISNLTDRRAEDYLAETEYVHFLASEGASVADSLPSKSGNRVELIGGVAAAMFEIAGGDQIAEHGYRYRDGAPLEEYFYNTGKTLGKIHALSKRYEPKNPRFDFFDQYNEAYFEELIPDDLICTEGITGRTIKDRLHETLEELRKLGQTKKNYGMVHFDFSDGNYNIDYGTGRISVFDFDNCRSCWYMFDIANLWSHGRGWIARNPDPEERHRFMDGYMKTVIEGYRSECEIDDEELSRLELMVNTVLMENIIDEFEVQRAEDDGYAFDEDECRNLICFAEKIPWMGYYS